MLSASELFKNYELYKKIGRGTCTLHQRITERDGLKFFKFSSLFFKFIQLTSKNSTMVYDTALSCILYHISLRRRSSYTCAATEPFTKLSFALFLRWFLPIAYLQTCSGCSIRIDHCQDRNHFQEVLEKWFPLNFKTPISIQIKSKLIQSIFCSSFFLCLHGQSELCGSYHLLQSCSSFFVRLHGQLQLFGNYHLLQSSFSFFVVYMAKLSRLVAASFSSLALLVSVSTANLRCLLSIDHLLQS